MEFYDVVRKRRSYRVYKSDMPEEEKVTRILDAARLAPTWGNKQGMQYIVVKDPDTVRKVWNAIGQAQKFIEAPMFIVGIISESGSGINSNGIKYFPLDCGICFEHLILAATFEGLATCWIGWFNESKIQEILEIPNRYRVLALTPLGYPVKEKGEIVERKSLDEIVHYNKF
ncbi:MAG: nitroreductase family protein [Candidatus Lokiarchaeota archaeon]|nr:nitroreductase family protein [Candidatus Lokiarchaeota archaeon]